jgi:VWFA-related protein
MKSSRTFACQCVLMLSFNAALPSSARSQTQARPPLSKDQIRVVTNEVISPVTVTDTSGEFVLDLARKDFHVFDDGVEQTIEQWDLGGDPLAVALLIDTSTHLHAMEPTIHRMGSIFTETVMALDGEAAVITYDSTVDVRQPFTEDHDAVQKAIAETKFEVPEMKLYDAMAAAVELLKAQPTKRRRIMLILGESQDSGSKANLGQIVRDAEHANIAIYAVGPSSIAADLRGSNKGVAPLKLPGTPRIETVPPVDTDPLGRPIPVYDWMTPAMWLLQRGTNEIKNHQLEVAAAATGGIHYRAFRDSTIRGALDRIGGELHAQYIIGYRPSAERAPGFHAITVTISRPKVSIRTRPGYYLAPTAN